jgi:hypothetical protein
MPTREDLQPLKIGGVVKRIPVIIIDKMDSSGNPCREFWTDDGHFLGAVRVYSNFAKIEGSHDRRMQSKNENLE